MKLQYLGDSKDSFKWDYHHFLTHALGYSKLHVAWMMTPDDGKNHGNTAPELYPADAAILLLCQKLRSTRDPNLIQTLPTLMGATYSVSFHDSGDANNPSFFSGIHADHNHVVFLDPDNGFEPERSATNQHVRYDDLEQLLVTLPSTAVVTVFQHHRRKKFQDDFARIRERLPCGHTTAIYAPALMFVCISMSPEAIERVCAINHDYARQRPVQVLP